LSTGNTVPADSFLYFMLGQNNAMNNDLLYGEIYLKSTETGELQDFPLVSQGEDESRKQYVCSQMSFLVRSQAFCKALRWHGEIGSLQSQVDILWNACSKGQLYRIVSTRFVDRIRPNHEFVLVKVREKLEKSFPKRTLLGGLLRTGLFGWGLNLSVRVYFSLPGGIQRAMVAAINRVVLNRHRQL
jgi:hypothetical protein